VKKHNTKKNTGKYRRFSPAEDRALRKLFPHVPTAEVARILGFTLGAVYSRAQRLGIKKSRALREALMRGAVERCLHYGAATRFVRGQQPHNAGKKMWWDPGRSVLTRFRPGQRPPTWMPVGSVRVTHEGYLQRKLTDTGYTPRDWVGLHTIKWQRYRGPIPPGHALVFRDGDKRNVKLSNLELVSRAELMRRNSVHRLPEELKEVIRLNGVIKRTVRKYAQKQTQRSA
jgi:hypothetical protein